MKSFSEFLFEMIRKRGSQFVVLDSKGKKVLGKHKTKEKAMKQLAAIEISKKSLAEQIDITGEFSGFYHPKTKRTVVLPKKQPGDQHGYFVFLNPDVFGLTSNALDAAAGVQLHRSNADEYSDVLNHAAHQQGWVRVHANSSSRKQANEYGEPIYDLFMSSTDKDSLRQAIVDHSNAFGNQVDKIEVDYYGTKEGPGNGSTLDWNDPKTATIESRTGIPAAMRKLF
jgi:hypothetical protein